jgi:U3 small nucleolar RNA-associated protein 19
MVGKRKASEETVELDTLKKIRTNNVLEYINSLENLIRNDKTQLNRILEFFEYLKKDSKKIKTLRAVMHALRNIFHDYELFRPKNQFDKAESSHEEVMVANETVLEWLKLRYVEFLDQAFLLMGDESPKLQVIAFDVIMSCVRYETSSFSKLDRKRYSFANDLFLRMVQAVLSRGHTDSTLVWARMLDGYLNVYDDVRFYFYKNVAKYLRKRVEKHDSKSRPIVSLKKRYVEGNKVVRPRSFDDLTNCLWQLLPNIRMVTVVSELDSFLASNPEKTSHLLKLKEHQRVFEDCWLAFLNLPLSSALHKQILMFFDKGIMPHMLNPTMLMDFLTDSYDMGGSTSLLALNSLFLLITKHNL